MKKLFPIFIMMSLFSVSCNKSTGDSSSETTSTSTQPATTDSTSNVVPDPVPVIPPPVISSLPALALSFDTNIMLVNFSADEEAKYNRAIEITKMVVGTEAFKNQVLNFSYGGVKAFIDNKGRSNKQIYQSILEAAETLQPLKNNTMDLEVQLYYAANSVVGYTNGGTKRIWVNRKFFSSYKENSVAGNLFHEWLHKLGYTHSYSSTPTRPYSVPYAIGYIMGNIGKSFL